MHCAWSGPPRSSRSAVKPYLTYLSFHLCVFGIVESRKPLDKINNNFVTYVASILSIGVLTVDNVPIKKENQLFDKHIYSRWL